MWLVWNRAALARLDRTLPTCPLQLKAEATKADFITGSALFPPFGKKGGQETAYFHNPEFLLKYYKANQITHHASTGCWSGPRHADAQSFILQQGTLPAPQQPLVPPLSANALQRSAFCWCRAQCTSIDNTTGNQTVLACLCTSGTCHLFPMEFAVMHKSLFALVGDVNRRVSVVQLS